jgi:hypothetical protein
MLLNYYNKSTINWYLKSKNVKLNCPLKASPKHCVIVQHKAVVNIFSAVFYGFRNMKHYWLPQIAQVKIALTIIEKMQYC